MAVSIEVKVDPQFFRIYGELHHIIGGEYHGKTEFIPRITPLLTEEDASLSFKLKRCQFSVRLAFSITINKAQGQSVKRVRRIAFRVPVFSRGQLYVALSQATNS